MHETARIAMGWFRDGFVMEPGTSVADVGSYDVNGTVRDLFEHCAYTGLDIAEGPGVDRVITLEDFGSEQYDVVISVSTLEHVEDMAQFARECIKITKPGGLLCIIAPHGMSGFDLHSHPLDCWRIWPDGMRWLFRATEIIECSRHENDTFLIARRPCPA